MADRSFLAWPFLEDRHRALQAGLDDWAATHVPALIDHHDADGSCRKLVAAMGKAGFLTHCAPEAATAGAKLDVRSLCVARETLAYHGGLADFAFAMQGLGTGPISLFGTAAQKARYLPGVAAGTAIAAFALSEANAGSDVAAMSTTATPDGPDHVRLNGEKTWISNGGIADHYVVFARDGAGTGTRNISAYIVDAGQPGFDIAARLDVTAPHPLATLRFKDCRVSLSQRIGGSGDGFKIAMATLDVFRSTVGAAALGLARRALDEALERAATRPMQGGVLADLQLTQAALAESATEIDAAALLIYRAAWTKDCGAARITREAAMAKMFATEMAQRVIDRAVQIFGGEGVRVGAKVEELYREVRALRIYEGATEVQKVIIARALLAGRDAAPPAAKPAVQEETPPIRHSAHVDTFARDNLPPRDLWPDLVFPLPELQYPERLNAVSELLDKHVSGGRGQAPCLISSTGESWTYAETAAQVNRIANVLTGSLGFKPGHRVLLRAPNSPMLAAIYLAVLKAGGVVVATMPMLRARELSFIIQKARVFLAFCDPALLTELESASKGQLAPIRIVDIGQELPALMAAVQPEFTACDTASDDVCLIGFTSGTTGEPKATMHMHRDLLAVCDSYGAHVLKANASDRFIGSPPLAFTFGLGGLVLFPLRVGASTILLERPSPDDLLAAMVALKPTVCFTAPTAYRALAAKMRPGDCASLRICVSAGEALPLATFEAWKAATGITLQDGIGATEMLHIFISATVEQVRPGATGKAVPGYEARIIDDQGRELPPGSVGRLAVRGPTGCRYMADSRQVKYVENGWNVTGDTYLMDSDGYFWYQARSDDMIISSGYNIAGPEVEASLMMHPAVAECGVVGAADADRGMIVKAYVVLKPGHPPDDDMAKTLQDHVKADIAPYKYPRAITFVSALPRTETGKLQRFQLRQMAKEAPPARTTP